MDDHMPLHLQFLFEAYRQGFIPGVAAPRSNIEAQLGWMAIREQLLHSILLDEERAQHRTFERTLDLRHQHRYIRSGDVTEYVNESTSERATSEECDASWLEGTNAVAHKKKQQEDDPVTKTKGKKKRNRSRRRFSSTSFGLSDTPASSIGTPEQFISDTEDAQSINGSTESEALREQLHNERPTEPNISDVISTGEKPADREVAAKEGQPKKKRKRIKSKSRTRLKLSVFNETVQGAAALVDNVTQSSANVDGKQGEKQVGGEGSKVQPRVAGQQTQELASGTNERPTEPNISDVIPTGEKPADHEVAAKEGQPKKERKRNKSKSRTRLKMSVFNETAQGSVALVDNATQSSGNVDGKQGEEQVGGEGSKVKPKVAGQQTQKLASGAIRDVSVAKCDQAGEVPVNKTSQKPKASISEKKGHILAQQQKPPEGPDTVDSRVNDTQKRNKAPMKQTFTPQKPRDQDKYRDNTSNDSSATEKTYSSTQLKAAESMGRFGVLALGDMSPTDANPQPQYVPRKKSNSMSDRGSSYMVCDDIALPASKSSGLGSIAIHAGKGARPKEKLGPTSMTAADWTSTSKPVLNRQRKAENIQNIVGLPNNIPSSSGTIKYPPAKMDFKTFPLETTHDFRIACDQCIQSTNKHGQHILLEAPHKCEKDTLVVRKKSETNWLIIRERLTNHTKYIRCRFFNATSANCKGDTCGFAHSQEELDIWTHDAHFKFNIHEFVIWHRNQDTGSQFTTQQLRVKYPGFFLYLCKSCYISKPPRLSPQGNTQMCSAEAHSWGENTLLCHVTTEGAITIIAPRPLLKAYFMCPQKEYCDARWRDTAPCRQAHSLLERDVWIWERDAGENRTVLVHQEHAPSSEPQSQRAAPSPAATTVPSTDVLAQPIKEQPANANATAFEQRKPTEVDACLAKYKASPYSPVEEICGKCLKMKMRTKKHNSFDRCAKMSHVWSQHRIYYLPSQKKEIRECPGTAKKYVMCSRITNKQECNFHKPCHFAHFEEERLIWNWMCYNGVRSVGQLIEKPPPQIQTRQADPPKDAPWKDLQPSTAPALTQIQAEQTSQATVATVPTASQTRQWLSSNAYYCVYCSTACNNQRQLDQHCSSLNHEFNVNSDKEHNWNYRQPPWNVHGGKYRLCSEHKEGRSCAYSGVPQDYNFCRFAHSERELDEWKERWEWRKMKREQSKNSHMFSYMDKLWEQYSSSPDELDILCENHPNVVITCTSDLLVSLKDKAESHSWIFEIHSNEALKVQKVALLLTEGRSHFSMHDALGSLEVQILSSEDLPASTGTCRVLVDFKAGMYGIYKQWVVFDFGTKPVIVRKLQVEVASRGVHSDLQTIREQIDFDRWSPSTKEIVPMTNNSDSFGESEFEVQLLKKYKAPSSSRTVIDQEIIGVETTKENYKRKMHKLLYLEEFECAGIIAKFVNRTSMQVTQFIQDPEAGVFEVALQGQMFGQIPLDENLSADSPAGRLILMHVSKALIKKENDPSNRVYEAHILVRDRFDGRTQSCIYVSLSESCIRDYQLADKETVEVEIQFQMDRLPFCKMHLAVERLANMNVIFPDVTKIQTPEWQNAKTFELRSEELNPVQTEVVRQILTDRPGPSLPVICYGPFGTGKTETLAQAVMLLVKERNGRVLLCTHTNSAADLYITRFFHDYRQKNNKLNLIRVYHTKRRTFTVDDTVKKYCKLTPDQSKFVLPSPDEIKDNDVVITTVATAAYLLQYNGLVGAFTHIIVDEAAQVLESEILIPFALASETTGMVIAGDHIQSRPEVFNETARNQHFDRSVLERLFLTYGLLQDQKYQTAALNHLLKVNYRTHKTILQFLATAFYGGPDNLICGKNQAEIPGRGAIVFFSAQGAEHQDTNSTSYYNQAEVDELVSRICDLCQQWPEQWGSFKPERIGVVCAYEDQIYRIRNVLRQKGLTGVNVGPVASVQGKEFTALFISTVRTRHTQNEQVEGVNLGFLSDRHLLNTALTRTESFVGVVGDPVALCSIGDCAGIWRAYLTHCQDNNSIYPNSLTTEIIKLEIKSALSLKMPKENQKSHKSYFRAASFCWDDDESLPADDIIKQLAKEAQQGSNVVIKTDSHFSDEPLKMEYIKISEIGDQAVLSYSPPPTWPDTRPKRNLLSADDYDKQFDSDDETPNDDHLRNRCEHTEQQLLAMSKQNPGRYKRCILHVHSSFRIRATVRDGDDNMREIRISNRKRCGRAFNQDEVLVEVLPKDEEEQKLGTCQDDNLPDGAVIGVISRSIDPSYRKFVCTIDESFGMIPLNVGYHRMVCLSPSHYAERAKKGGAVCVYTFSSDKSVKFDRLEKIHPSDFRRKLFVVRFLKWDATFNCPLCIVIDILPPGSDLDKGIDILNLEHFVPKQFRIDTVDQARHIKRTFTTGKMRNRTDLREQLTITIDPEGSQDLDDALSFEEMQTGECRIGVHIADVSHFLKKDDRLDLEAQARGTTFYPSGCDPVPMLPTELSNDVCSLKPNADRLSLSVFAHIDAQGNILQRCVEQCIVKVGHRLTYKEAEDILTGEMNNTHAVELQKTLQKLSSLAQSWRKARLGNEALYHSLDHESEESPMAHLLVQEMMLMANREVTAILMEHYPKCTPLRTDIPPDEDELNKWREEFSRVARNTVALRQPFLPQGQLCTCKKQCTCIPTEMTPNSNQNITMRTAAWEKIISNLNDQNLAFNIANPFNMPEAEIAYGRLYRLKGRANYVCSGDHPRDKLRHNTLNMRYYTHFTSPIRRYVDVVVHRLLTCIIENKPCPYTQEEMSAVCIVCTNASQRANQYETATARLHLATILEKRPVVMFPTVETVSDTAIQLRASGVKCIQAKQNEIKMPALQPSSQPIYNEDTKTVLIKWQDRIYVKDLPDQEKHPESDKEYTVNQSRFVIQIPERQWQDLLKEIRSGTPEEVKDASRSVQSNVVTLSNPSDDDKLHSEVVDIAHASQHCKYRLALHPADVMKTQMCARVDRGILTPSLQMLELTHEVHVCLQHRTNPVECFANAEPEYASKMRYKSLEQYKALWLKLVEIESAMSAIKDGDSMVIQNVDITWSSRNGEIKGYFDVQNDFCEARNLQFGGYAGREDDDESDTDEAERKDQMLDYFCVQYCDVSSLCRAEQEIERSFDIDFAHSTTWVGHCLSTGVEQKKGEVTRVWLKLLPTPVAIPQDLLLDDNKKRASVEYILKSLPKWREEEALHKIGSRSKLATGIALGTNTPELSEAYIQQARSFAHKTIDGLRPANDSQQKAIEKAMTGSFTLIQGPPGTGKTVTGVRLANLFALFNRSQLTDGQTRPQVMYCGPSNKSVDVVADYILKQGPTAPKIVRVYGSLIEKEDFPMPRDTFTPNKKRTTYNRSGDVEKSALHFMIRNEKECTKAKDIHMLDTMRVECIKDKIDMSREEKKAYRELIREAKTEVLKKAEIILCTCHTSSGTTLEVTNIRQVIIDECGMCTEPEAMIPIVACRPEQVVLIGDHKQLRPVVIDRTAGKLGLETSLFQRYSRKAQMLIKQYRMHEAIAEFPSKHFYDNKLVCGTLEQTRNSPLRIWPNGCNKPIAFLHVVGKEESLKVSTAEGSEQSKSNADEVLHTVRVAFQLVRNFRIKPKDILILSQYRAQCAEIKTGLQQKGIGDVAISTVVSAQGSECEYVILSTVRSLPKSQIERKPTKSWYRRNLGFITDENQINVALTRAKKGLVIIGNRNLLASHPMWRKLIEAYRQQKKVLDAAEFCHV